MPASAAGSGWGWQANCEAVNRALAVLITLSNPCLVLHKGISTKNLIRGRVYSPGDKSSRVRGLPVPAGWESSVLGPCCPKCAEFCTPSVCSVAPLSEACGLIQSEQRRRMRGAFPPCPPAVTVAAHTRGGRSILSGCDLQLILSTPTPRQPGPGPPGIDTTKCLR